MKKLFKKILGIGAILILLVNLVSAGSISTPRVLATNQHDDECNEIFTYEKTSDYNDTRVSINFENSDEQIDVSAVSGYEVVEVWLDVESDNKNGYFLYATGPVNNFNPNPGGDIDKAKVKVKKVCAPWSVVINEQVSCGNGSKTFTGTASYGGDTTTTLLVKLNGNTVINSENENVSWSFSQNVNAGSSYTINSYVYDNSDPDTSGSHQDTPKATDSWSFTVPACAPTDLCSNIDGVQASVPAGYTESNGVCTEIPVDVCPNVDGVQTSTNECPEPTPNDVCPNVDGVQTSTNECPTNEIDVCLNIEGTQTSLPEGYEFEEEGICILASGQGVTPTPTDIPTPTPTSVPTNTGGPGDGLSDGRTESLGGAQSTPASTSQKQGEVLGVSTFAATGDIATDIATIQQALGFAFATFGAVIYGNKKKTSKKTK